MRYVSIDIETTGLDENTCQILSIGAVIEDSNNILPLEEMPRFHAVIPHRQIQGEPFALNLNKELIELINKYHMAKTPVERDELAAKNNVIFIYQDNIWKTFNEFLRANNMLGKTTIAGKNYLAFDKKFLDKIEGWTTLNWHRRVLDPGTSFVDWKNDTEIPDLNKCIQRSGIEGVVSHNALEDAFDVVRILRTKY